MEESPERNTARAPFPLPTPPEAAREGCAGYAAATCQRTLALADLASSFFGGWKSCRMRPGVSDVTPRKTKHISSVVCSPKRTARGGVFGLFGLPVLLS